MIIQQKGYSYNDLTIIPADTSVINSRSECNPFVKGNFLPIFTAPMASIVNEDNINKFLENSGWEFSYYDNNKDYDYYFMYNGVSNENEDYILIFCWNGFRRTNEICIGKYKQTE